MLCLDLFLKQTQVEWKKFQEISSPRLQFVFISIPTEVKHSTNFSNHIKAS